MCYNYATVYEDLAISILTDTQRIAGESRQTARSHTKDTVQQKSLPHSYEAPHLMCVSARQAPAQHLASFKAPFPSLRILPLPFPLHS